jgi:hypothetical protein
MTPYRPRARRSCFAAAIFFRWCLARLEGEPNQSSQPRRGVPLANAQEARAACGSCVGRSVHKGRRYPRADQNDNGPVVSELANDPFEIVNLDDPGNVIERKAATSKEHQLGHNVVSANAHK